MHVAQVIETGSASPYWCATLELLVLSGLDVSVLVTGHDDGLGVVASRLGAGYTVLGSSSVLDWPLTASRLRRWVAMRHLDLLHVHEAIPWTIVRLAFPHRHPVPFIFHRHHNHQRGLQNALSRFGSKAADRVFAVSASSARSAVAEGTPEALVDVMWNGVPDLRTVDPGEAAALRTSLGISRAASVMVLVARLREEKGHDVAIAARAILEQRRSEGVHLVIVGDGPLRQQLDREARVTPAIHVTGHTDDVSRWYAIADVVVVPSRSEPFGLVAIEALAVRRPLVVSATGGLLEIVRPGIDGLVAPTDDPEGLADRVEQLLDDRSLAERLVSAGRQRYEDRFTADAMVGSWVQGYRFALMQASTRGALE